MTRITKAFFFRFNGKDILKAHLFEHCLGAYFFDHHIPFYKAKTHPLGVYVLFDKEVPNLHKIANLEPYINNQKKRVNLELLEALDTRSRIIETMHELYSDKFSDALSKIESILDLDTQELAGDFERIFETKTEITGLSVRLPKVSVSNGFQPTEHRILIPKLNKEIDVVEIAIRVPQSIENVSYLANLYIQIKDKLKELTNLGESVYRIRYNIITLQGGYQYFTYSLKTKAGRGKKTLDMLLGLLKDLELKEAAFSKWKSGMVERLKKNWQVNKLTDLLMMELVLWRRVLKPSDFENLDYQTMVDLHQKIFSSRNTFLLTDF